jgi:hypothetical protein
VGTGRTLAMQRVWDRVSYYETQTSTLRRLTEIAPDLAPHTLVVVLDEGDNWRSTWAFRHAVQYLYQDRAMGYVWGSWDFMFPTRVTPAGIVCEPWREVAAAWGAPPTRHRYDELVLLRNGKDGALSLLDDWPASLPVLPAGARYDPRARIRSLQAPLPEREILGSAEGRVGEGAAVGPAGRGPEPEACAHPPLWSSLVEAVLSRQSLARRSSAGTSAKRQRRSRRSAKNLPLLPSTSGLAASQTTVSAPWRTLRPNSAP